MSSPSGEAQEYELHVQSSIDLTTRPYGNMTFSAYSDPLPVHYVTNPDLEKRGMLYRATTTVPSRRAQCTAALLSLPHAATSIHIVTVEVPSRFGARSARNIDSLLSPHNVIHKIRPDGTVCMYDASHVLALHALIAHGYRDNGFWIEYVPIKRPPHHSDYLNTSTLSKLLKYGIRQIKTRSDCTCIRLWTLDDRDTAIATLQSSYNSRYVQFKTYEVLVTYPPGSTVTELHDILCKRHVIEDEDDVESLSFPCDINGPWILTFFRLCSYTSALSAKRMAGTSYTLSAMTKLPEIEGYPESWIQLHI